MTCPLSNYVHVLEVTSCSQPLNYQPNTAGNFQCTTIAQLPLGVSKILQNLTKTLRQFSDSEGHFKVVLLLYTSKCHLMHRLLSISLLHLSYRRTYP